jgi:hypothetical protein
VAAAGLIACSSSSDAPTVPAPTRDAASAGTGGNTSNGGAAGAAGGRPDEAGGAAGLGMVVDAAADPSSGATGGTAAGSAGVGGAGGDGVTRDSGNGNGNGAGGASNAGATGGGGASPARDAATDGPRAGEAGPPVIELFNGTDLTGWTISTTWPPALSSKAPLTTAQAQSVFKVEGGMIHDYADAVDGSDQVRATLTTVASYSNYKLSVDYRWGTKKFSPYVALARDAGILFHVTGDRAKVWPDSTEFQIKENETGDIYALNSTCTSLSVGGGLTFVDAPQGLSKLIDGTGGNAPHHHLVGMFELPDWNTVELTVNQDSAVYVVNGHMVNRVFNIKDTAGRRVTTGPIVLQAEHAEVFYRNVRLQVLP